MQHKDDPLFLEFLESHTANKGVWNNDTALTAIQCKEHSDDDDEEASDKDDSDEGKVKEEEEEDGKHKIADKVISDLEVIRILKDSLFYRLF